jgi:multiple sugar transport system ATP-binding protein
MAEISFHDVSKIYDGRYAAVHNLSLDVRDGEFMVLVGPSGCGKSTALRMVAGLEEITAGELRINGKRCNDLSPRDRDIAMVFQSYALYPHLTVAENIAFGLRVRGVERQEVERKVRETGELLELTDYLDRKPAKLSGGQRQRVAMGRALVRSPNAFLMDEPLSNLDARLRGQMRSEISKLQRMTAVTTIYVTHDQVEAMTMGDRVAVMNKGTLQQLDAPRALYDKPKNLFVASFIGTPPINFLRGVLVAADGQPALRMGALTIGLGSRLAQSSHDGRQVIAGIRPEALRIGVSGEPGLKVVVAFVEDLGATLLLHLDSPEAEVVPASVVEDDVDLEAVRPRLRAVVDGSLKIRNGDSLVLTADPAAIHLFDASTGDAL